MADNRDAVTLPDGRSIESLRVVDLKQELKKRGLSNAGSKSHLADRLKAQIYLEELKQAPVHEGVPNRDIVEDESVASNSFIQQYLKQQQEQLRQRHENVQEQQTAKAFIPEGLANQVEELNQSLSSGQTEDSEKEAEDAKNGDGEVEPKAAVVAAAPEAAPPEDRPSRRSRRQPSQEEDQETRKSRRKSSRSRESEQDQEEQEEIKALPEADQMQTIAEQGTGPDLDQQEVKKDGAELMQDEPAKDHAAEKGADETAPVPAQCQEVEKAPLPPQEKMDVQDSQKEQKEDAMSKAQATKEDAPVPTGKPEVQEAPVIPSEKMDTQESKEEQVQEKEMKAESKVAKDVEPMDASEDVSKERETTKSDEKLQEEGMNEDVDAPTEKKEAPPVEVKDPEEAKAVSEQPAPAGDEPPQQQQQKEEKKSPIQQRRVRLNRSGDLSRARGSEKPPEEDQKATETPADSQATAEDTGSLPGSAVSAVSPRKRVTPPGGDEGSPDTALAAPKRRKTESDEDEADQVEPQPSARAEAAATPDTNQATSSKMGKGDGKDAVAVDTPDTEDGEIKEEGEVAGDSPKVEEEQKENKREEVVAKPHKLSIWPVCWSCQPG